MYKINQNPTTETVGTKWSHIDSNFNELQSQFMSGYNLLVKKVGDTLFILTDYNATNNLAIRFKHCLKNNIYTFSQIGLLSKSTPFENVEISLDLVILEQSNLRSDCIGPISMNGGWCGGNHIYSDELTKTIESSSYKVTINNKEILENIVYKTDDILIEVTNNVYDYSLLPNVFDVCMIETVFYRIKKTNIEVFVKHDFLKASTINLYYGMQATEFTNSWEKRIYAAHSNNNILQDITANMNFGNITNFSNIEKLVSCNLDKSVCMSMYINNIGLYTTRNINVSDSIPIAFVSDLKKQYFALINKPTIRNIGDSHYWSGCYSFFDNKNNENGILFNYDICVGGKLIKSIDIEDAGVFDPKLDMYFGKNVTIVKKDNTIQFPDTVIFNSKLMASGYGNIYLLIN